MREREREIERERGREEETEREHGETWKALGKTRSSCWMFWGRSKHTRSVTVNDFCFQTILL